MDISVVIPVYQDDESLNKCLEALEFQQGSFVFEVLIVNNYPAQKISLDKNYQLDIRIFEEWKVGSYAARNRGIQESQSNLIAFTDADCIPYSDWLFQIKKVFDSENVDRICGPVQLSVKEKIQPSELIEVLFDFNQQQFVHRGWAMTANLAVRKDIFEKVGLFNDELVSGGDQEWNMRASSFSLDYRDNIIVRHPSRSLSQHLIKTRRVYSFFYAKQKKKYPFIVVFLLGLLHLKPPLRAWIKVFKNRAGYSGMLIIQSFIYIYILRYQIFLEHYRLLFGGKPVRL